MGEIELSAMYSSWRLRRWIVVCLLLIPAISIYKLVHHQRLNCDLIDTVKSNDTKGVVKLLDEGADANAREYDRRDLAIKVRIRKLWQEFRHTPPEIDYSNDVKLTALELLFAGRQDGNYNTTQPQENHEIATALLSHGADVNAQTVPDATPFERAVWLNQPSTATIPREATARPRGKHCNGRPKRIDYYTGKELVGVLPGLRIS